METYIAQLKDRIKDEKNRYDYETCLDLIDIIRRDITVNRKIDINNHPRWDARYIGRSQLHRNINFITRREYWTRCSELREFAQANRILIYGDYVSQTYSDGVPSYYPRLPK